MPLTVNLTSNSTGSSNYSPVSGGGSQAIAEISVTSQEGASTAIGAIDSALAYVQAERSNLGSIQNRLTHTIDNLSNIVTSTSAAQSRIRDTDYAKETSELQGRLSAIATAMLARLISNHSWFSSYCSNRSILLPLPRPRAGVFFKHRNIPQSRPAVQ